MPKKAQRKSKKAQPPPKMQHRIVLHPHHNGWTLVMPPPIGAEFSQSLYENFSVRIDGDKANNLPSVLRFEYGGQRDMEAVFRLTTNNDGLIEKIREYIKKFAATQNCKVVQYKEIHSITFVANLTEQKEGLRAIVTRQGAEINELKAELAKITRSRERYKTKAKELQASPARKQKPRQLKKGVKCR